MVSFGPMNDTERPLILLTNDDGIRSPGLWAAAEALQGLGFVTVVAPREQASGTGRSMPITSDGVICEETVEVGGKQWKVYAVGGTPAQAVQHGVLELMPRKPDLVVAGINYGENVGLGVTISGTVGAALEGAALGVPSMAVSLELSDNLDYARAARIARQIFERYTASEPPAGVCLNVNIPALDSGWPKGVRVCPQSTVPADAQYRKQTDPGGRQIFWLEPGSADRAAVPNSDTKAVLEGYVAITPLRFDATDRQMLSQIEDWSWPQSFE